jgi:hypothetical protein
MRIYIGKDRKNATEITTAHPTVRSLTRRVKWVGHKLYMDNSFSSQDISDDLHTRSINCCVTCKQNCEGMLGEY